MSANIHTNHETLSPFCRRWHIRRLWLFGSVLPQYKLLQNNEG